MLNRDGPVYTLRRPLWLLCEDQVGNDKTESTGTGWEAAAVLLKDDRSSQ